MGGDIDLLSINTIRTLWMDAVQKATSGRGAVWLLVAPTPSAWG